MTESPVLCAVVEIGACDGGGRWWPTGAGRSSWGLLPLDGTLSDDDIGAVLECFAEHTCPDTDEADDGGDPVATAAEAVAWIVGADALGACGGLRITAPDGTRVDPSCCADLDAWREWSRPDRGDMWLGHSPAPWIEERGTGVRVHPEGGVGGRVPCETGFVDITDAELAAALAAVRRELADFLGAVRRWAGCHAPTQADALVAALDRLLHVSEPLPAS